MAQSRVLILCQLFYPELISTGLTVTELAVALRDDGVDVEVICGPPTIVDRTTSVSRFLVHKGIRIQRVWGTRFSKLSVVGKLLNHLTFFGSVLIHLFTVKLDRPVIVFTNPPFLPLTCAIVSWFRPIRIIHVMFDVYPDTAVSMGLLAERSVITRLWHWVNDICFRRADAIVAIGRCMVDRIKPRLKAVDHHKLRTIHVWADDAHLQRDGAVPLFREMWGVGPDQLVAAYSGNMGRFHDINCFVDAAFQLASMNRFQFWFVGQGYAKLGAIKHATQLGVPNCQFHDYVDREELPDLLASIDVGLVSLMPNQVGLSVPSKTYGLLAAGVPVIAVMPQASEIARVVNEANCGWVVEPGDLSGLVSAFRALAQLSKAERVEMGNRGQVLLSNRYRLVHAAQAYRHLIDHGLTVPDHLVND